jgi:hypothetical protein
VALQAPQGVVSGCRRVPDEADLEPALKAQLGEFCMEAFGHLRFALNDAEPMFEAELRALGEVLGVAGEYRPPTA